MCFHDNCLNPIRMDVETVSTCYECLDGLKPACRLLNSPSEQLSSSAGFGVVVLQRAEAVRRQNAVTLFSESVVARRVPLRQLAGVAPRHQRVLQRRVPLFVPQENLAPLLTRNLRTEDKEVTD